MINKIKKQATTQLVIIDNKVFNPVQALFNKSNEISRKTHSEFYWPLESSRRIHQNLLERNLQWMLE